MPPASPPPAPSPFSLSHFCSLADALLRPFTEEKKPLILTKDSDKLLLVSLTKLSFALRASAEDSPSNYEVVVELHSGAAPSHEMPHNCVKEVVSVLVNYLSVPSEFVRHATGNMLIALSDFLIQNDSQWEEFIKLLSFLLGEAILKVRSSSSVANLLEITGLLYVFRKILKILKQEDSDRDGTCIPVLSECILELNWDLLLDAVIIQDKGDLVTEKGNVSLLEERASFESRGMLLGVFLQLFCSLVDQDCLGELRSSSSDEILSFRGIIELVPKLLCWCFSFSKSYNSDCIAVYVRRKTLVLMARLSSCIIQECSTLILWLELLQMHFVDVLDLPLPQSNSCLDNSLDDSPFVQCTAGVKASNICSWHIWRRVMFLLFKFSSNIINLSNEHCVKCSCTTASPSPLCCIHPNGQNYELGISILCHWIQRHLPQKEFVKLETYMMQSRNIGASFLQLFLHEDDLLFDMLLLLLDFPLNVHPIEDNENELPSDENKVDQLCYLSCIFDPVQIFHIFLKQLHYDPSVLLDYLISKDTGVQCAQYLLRCLRLLCQSEAMFMGFKFTGNKCQPFYKKRRLCSDIHGVDSLEKLQPLLSATGSKHSFLSVSNNFRQQEFENARKCLFSLKMSVQNLHEKKLFPYNPAALLRSFAQFQELCCKKEKEHSAESDVM